MRIWRGGDLLRGANREELYHEMRVLRPIPARAVSAVDSLLLELDVICSLCMYIVVILTINEKFSKNLRSAYLNEIEAFRHEVHGNIGAQNIPMDRKASPTSVRVVHPRFYRDNRKPLQGTVNTWMVRRHDSKPP